MSFLDDIANGLSNFVSNLGKASGNTAAKADQSVSKTSTKKKHRVSPTKNTVSVNDIANAGKAANNAASSFAKTSNKATATNAKASGGYANGESVTQEPSQPTVNFVNNWQEQATKGLGIPDMFTGQTQAQQKLKEEGAYLDTDKKLAEEQKKTPEEAQALYEDEDLQNDANEYVSDMIAKQFEEDGASAGEAQDAAQQIINGESPSEENNQLAQDLINSYIWQTIAHQDVAFIDPDKGIYIAGSPVWNSIDWEHMTPEKYADAQQTLINAGAKDHYYTPGSGKPENVSGLATAYGLEFNPDVDTNKAFAQHAIDQGHGSYVKIPKNTIPGFAMAENPLDTSEHLNYTGLEMLYADPDTPYADFDWDKEIQRVDDQHDRGDLTDNEYLQSIQALYTLKEQAEEIDRGEEVNPEDWQFKWLQNNVTDPTDIKFYEDLQENAQNSFDELVKFYKANGEKDPEAKADEQLQQEYGVTHDQIGTLDFDKMSDEEREKWLAGKYGGTMVQPHTYHKVNDKQDIHEDEFWDNYQDELDKMWESDEQYYDTEKEAKKAFKSQTGLDSPEDIDSLTDEEINKIAHGEGPSGSMTQAHEFGREEGPYVRNYNGAAPAARQGIERWAGMDFRDIGDWYENTTDINPDTGDEERIGFIPRDYYDNAEGTRDASELNKLLANFESARKDYALENADFEVTTSNGDTYSWEDLFGEGTNPYSLNKDFNRIFDDPEKTGFLLDDGTFVSNATLNTTTDTPVEVDENGDCIFADGTKLSSGQFQNLADIQADAYNSGDYKYLEPQVVEINGSYVPMNNFFDANPVTENYGNSTYTWDQTQETKDSDPLNLGMGTVDTSGGYQFGTDQFNPNELPATIFDTALESAPFMAALGLGALAPVPFAGPAAGFVSSIPTFTLRDAGLDPDDFIQDANLRNNMAFSADPYTRGQQLYDNFGTGVDILSEGLGGWGRFKNMPKQTFRTNKKGNVIGAQVLPTEVEQTLEQPTKVSADVLSNPQELRTINHVEYPEIAANGLPIDAGESEATHWAEQLTPGLVDRVEEVINSIENPVARIPAGVLETAIEEGGEELLSAISDEWGLAEESTGNANNAWQGIPGVIGEYSDDVSNAQMWQNLLNREATGFAGGATLGGFLGGGMYTLQNRGDLKNYFKDKFLKQGADEQSADEAAERAATTTALTQEQIANRAESAPASQEISEEEYNRKKNLNQL